MRGEIDNPKLIVGNLNTLLSTMDRTSRQKINKEIEDLNNTVNQIDLIDIYRKIRAKLYSSQVHMDMVVHEKSFDKYRRIRIIQSILSDHSRMKLQINNKKMKIHKHMDIKQLTPK